MKKKMIITIASIAVVIAIAAVGTYAYLTSTKEATNVFTVGSVDIELKNDTWDSAAAENVYPGKTIATAPTVNNTGKNDCYVRVLVTVDKGTAWQTALNNHNISDLTATFAGYDVSKWTPGSVTANPDGSTTYQFLYKTVVTGTVSTVSGATTNTTGALFTSIKIPESFDNADFASIQGFSLKSVAQAIQANGFADGTAAFTAFDAK